MERAREHYGYWTERLSGMGEFREADRHNFLRACLVAGALRCFPAPEGGHSTPLDAALEQVPGLVDLEKGKKEDASAR